MTEVKLLETTLLYLIDGAAGKVMLANKKRGFGVNKINGVGGKLSPDTDKTIDDTCVRECEEECGVRPTVFHRRGTIDFFYQNKPHWDNRCAVYTATEWTGQLQETEEMKPDWFEVASVPYDRMWPDDEIWLPSVIKTTTEEVFYKFWFSEAGQILEYKKYCKEEFH